MLLFNFKILSACPLYLITDFGRSWRLTAWDSGIGSLKIVGGGVSVTGGSALVVAPEPLLTKVGGGLAVAFGSSLVVDGGTQIFGIGPQGGFNPIIEGAGAIGHLLNGEAGAASSRFWFGWASFSATLGGGFAKTSKLARGPLSSLPSGVKASLSEAYIKLLSNSKSLSNLKWRTPSFTKKFEKLPNGTTITNLTLQSGSSFIVDSTKPYIWAFDGKLVLGEEVLVKGATNPIMTLGHPTLVNSGKVRLAGELLPGANGFRLNLQSGRYMRGAGDVDLATLELIRKMFALKGVNINSVGVK